MPNMILPLRNKTTAMKSFPAQWLETQFALKFVQAADEIHLVGKQFLHTDADWVDALTASAASKQTKRLLMANPSVESPEWSDYHCAIFNSPSGRAVKLRSFQDYVAWLTA